MAAKYDIDSVDQKILSHLLNNARTPFLEIARECGISGAAIHQRVKKMEDAGIIIGSRMIVKPKALGFDMCAYVGVQLQSANLYSSVVEYLKQIPEVVECHFVTGEYVMFLKIYCRNNDHLMGVLIETLQNIPGVSKTNTFISLDQAFERQVGIKMKKDKKDKKEKK